METPTISKKQSKKTLSGKKKKAEVIKNVLVKPYQNYWPLLSPEDNNHLKETLQKFLPRVQPNKVNIPYSKIKSIPKDERKKFRETFNRKSHIDVSESCRQNLTFGVNDVAQLLENREASAVLVAGDVQPRLLVQHIIDQAVLYCVPILVVQDLRTLCKNKCGISGAVVALKNSIKPDSELGLIEQTVCNIYENYPVSDDHVNYHRKLDITTISIPDSEDRSVCILSDSEDDVVEKKNYQLKRVTARKRAFVPENLDNKLCSFIELDNGSASDEKAEASKVNYRPLKVKRVKGDKNRNKRKMEKFKKKKT